MPEIRFSGYGGQGIIRSGFIVGKACSLYDEKHATLNQAFGPEARGSACSAQVVVSDDRVLYPYITIPDILVSMSQEAYDKFEPELQKKGLLLIDEDLVRPKPIRDKITMYAIPATRMAEEMGNRIFANLVMLGFFTAMSDVVSADAMRKAIPGSVPDRFLDKNLEAFNKGYDFGMALKGAKKEPSPQKKAQAEPKAKAKKA
ncbi:MAG: 2-oxoacid:acceptor oxidoreductase family protein [Gemmatimonadota bacterium]|nr:MAG: 2-oxoacid:acceptor oxidoreductase family protein [Gemmatimonadota bacterium]